MTTGASVNKEYVRTPLIVMEVELGAAVAKSMLRWAGGEKTLQYSSWNLCCLFVNCIRYGVVANIIASHAIARGSIPRVGILWEGEGSPSQRPFYPHARPLDGS